MVTKREQKTLYFMDAIVSGRFWELAGNFEHLCHSKFDHLKLKPQVFNDRKLSFFLFLTKASMVSFLTMKNGSHKDCFDFPLNHQVLHKKVITNIPDVIPSKKVYNKQATKNLSVSGEYM